MLSSFNNPKTESIYDAHVKTEWRLPLLYQFLQLSPAYRLAHELNNFAVLSDREQPNDISTIQDIHSDLGEVWDCSAEEWWYRSARYFFEGIVEPAPSLIEQLSAQSITSRSQMDIQHYRIISDIPDRFSEFWYRDYANQLFPECAIVAIPLHGDPARMKKKVCEMIDHSFSKAKQPLNRSIYKLNKSSRIKILTLEKCLFAVKYKASHPNARLADVGDAITKRFDHTKMLSPDNRQAQRNLEAQTSEMLGKALILAEQSARIEFPSTVELDLEIISNSGPRQPYQPRFDYEFIASQISAGNISPP